MQVRGQHVTTGLQRWATGASYVGHENKLETLSPVITASSVSGDYAADLAANWFAGDQKWKAASASNPEYLRADFGAPVTIDMWAIYGHNLGTIGATVNLRYSNTGFATMTQWATFAPADNLTVMVKGAPVSARYWELQIVAPASAPVVALWFLGEGVRLYSSPPEGFRPPTLDREDIILNNRSDGGEFLGRSLIRTGGRAKIDVRFAPPAWMRGTWEPVRLAARSHPIFYAWNLDAYPGEVVLFYTDRPDRGPVYSTGGSLMEHTMEGIAL